MRKRIIGSDVDVEVVFRSLRRHAERNQTEGTLQVTLEASSRSELDQFTRDFVCEQIRVNGQSTFDLLIRTYPSGQPKQVGQKVRAVYTTSHFTITHDPSGFKSVAISLQFRRGYSSYGTTATTVFAFSTALESFDRRSEMTVSGTAIGGRTSFAINRKASEIRHRIRYEFGALSGTVASNLDVSGAWTIPESLAGQIPNATSGIATFHLDSLYDNKVFGTRSYSVVLQVPETMRPSFSGVTLYDLNSAARRLMPANNFIQIISDIQVSFSGASGVQGSQIISYRAELVGKNQSVTSNHASLGLMDWSGPATLRAWVVDSRGRESPKRDFSLRVHAYRSPALSFRVQRTGASSDTLTVYRTAEVTPLEIAGRMTNTMTLRFKVAERGTESYVDNTSSANGSWTTISSLTNSIATLSGTYPLDKTYVVVGTLSDAFHSVSFSWVVGTEEVVMSYGKDRIGFGKVADMAHAVDSQWDIYAKGSQLGFYATKLADDLDRLYTAGLYLVLPSTANRPVSGDKWGYVEVIVSNGVEHDNRSNWIWQRYYDTHGGQWERYKVNAGAFKPWLAPGLNAVRPVGCLYQSTVSTNPSALMGGEWTLQSNSNGIYTFKRTR